MKIAFFTDTFPPQINGVAISVHNFSRLLAARGHRVHLFTTTPAHVRLSENITTTHYAPNTLIKYPDFALATPKVIDCLKTIRTFKPDIIHAHMPSPLGWQAIVSAKTFSIPLVGTYHTFLPEFLNHTPLPKRLATSSLAKKLTWKYTNQFYNHCDHIIAPSPSIKHELKKNGLRKPITVISNGVDLTTFHPEPQPRTIDILHVGRISYEKNLDVLLRAIPLVMQEFPTVRVAIAGKGPDEEKLRALSKTLGIHNNVTFLGPQSHHELVHLYNQSTLFATASTIETEGLVVLEAMACGLPIIGVKKLALPNLVTTNGLLSTPGNAAALARNILTILHNEKLQKTMRRDSLRTARAYDLNASCTKLEALYRELIQKYEHSFLS